MQGTLLKFQIYQKAQLIKTVTVEESSVQIGSLPSAQLRIDDDLVSKMHALIERNGNQEITLTDLGSLNGTRLNGERIQQSALHSGDEIQIGNTKIVVFIDTVMAVSNPSRRISFEPQESIEELGAPTVVEVSALFEDSVIYTTQVHKQNSTKSDLRGLAYIVAGFLAIALFFAVFAMVVHKANFVEKDIIEWQAKGNLLKDYVYPSGFWHGPWVNILALVIFSGGVLSIVLGCFLKFGRKKLTKFTIGHSPEALFALDDKMALDEFPLVESTESGFLVHFTQFMAGELYSQDRVTPLAQLIQSGLARPSAMGSGIFAFSLPDKSKMHLHFDDVHFVIRSISSAKKLPIPVQLDWPFLGAAAGLITVISIILFLIPVDQKDVKNDSDDRREERKREEEDMNSRPVFVPPPKPKMPSIDAQKAGGGPPGKRHLGNEGKAGKPDAPVNNNRGGMLGDSVNPQMSRQQAMETAREAAKNAGVLGIIHQAGSPLHSPFGSDNAIGSDERDAIGGLIGTEVGDSYGVGGMGLVGVGGGGGGTGEGTIGLGNLGTIGRGNGGPGSGGYGRGVGSLSGRKGGSPEIIPGAAEVRGSLDKEIIRRVIRRHMNEVKFCYEKELMISKSPLGGRLMVNFTIDGQGRVISAVTGSSTLGNVKVEQCIVQAMRRWDFPKPQGGGIVVVTYPFVLKTSDPQ